jgi:mRNA-degrading endonuclease toxin of MazEF toxin-antitoxin module
VGTSIRHILVDQDDTVIRLRNRLFQNLWDNSQAHTLPQFAVALTSQPQRAGFPLTLELHSRGLPKKSWVKISQIRTLAVERIGKVMGRASPEELAQVVEGLNEIIGT